MTETFAAGDIVEFTEPYMGIPVGTRATVTETETNHILGSAFDALRVDLSGWVKTRNGIGRGVYTFQFRLKKVGPEHPFKVGDRVEFVEDYNFYAESAVIGAKGTVKKAYRDNFTAADYVNVKLDNGELAEGMAVRRIKLYEPPFKVGQKVRIPASKGHSWTGEGVVEKLQGESQSYDVQVRHTNGQLVHFYFNELEALPEPAEEEGTERDGFKIGDTVIVKDYHPVWDGTVGEVTFVGDSYVVITNEKYALGGLSFGHTYVEKHTPAPEPELSWTEQAEVGTYGYTLDGYSKIGRILHKTAENKWIIQYPCSSPSESYNISVLITDDAGMSDFISQEEFKQLV